MNISQLAVDFAEHQSQKTPEAPVAWVPGETNCGRVKREAFSTISAFVTFAKSQRLELTVTPIPLSPLEALRALVDLAAPIGAHSRPPSLQVAIDDARATLKAHDA